MASARQHLRVGARDRVCQQTVAHRPAVDEQVLVARVGAGLVQARGEPHQRERAGDLLHGQEAVRQPAAEDLGAALEGGRHGSVIDRDAAVGDQAEADRGIGDRESRHDLRGLLALRVGGAQELTADGRVVEERAHFDAGPSRGGLFAHAHHLPSMHFRDGGDVVSLRAAGDQEPRDARDRRHGLAPEAERGHLFDVGVGADLARRVPLEREQDVVGPHALAVVQDDQQIASPALEADLDRARRGVDRVFEELLEGRRGSLHDLARRDAAGDRIGKHGDARHGASIVSQDRPVRCRGSDAC